MRQHDKPVEGWPLLAKAKAIVTVLHPQSAMLCFCDAKSTSIIHTRQSIVHLSQAMATCCLEVII